MTVFADFGSTWSKIIDSSVKIIKTKEVPGEIIADFACGHNAEKRSKRYVNELIALSKGGLRLIDEKDFLLVDVGSRDIKYVLYRDGRFVETGWNQECGASQGFAIELLEMYYNIDCNRLELPENGYPVTCGLIGISRIFDEIIKTGDEENALARFVKGIAMNVYHFTGKPEKMYLSGGLCENRLFIESIPCEVVPLGRFVLVEGLKEIYKKGFC
ncbi:MAG: Activator of 2-hydroxyglutaryl-CoA dehydratase (HSP70-class ATPase domain)-like protein [bacterium]|nr:MAG: Activator of 2-hydroxyglutaryl-CoA dehydratase (HSP70-class ATPase domain)-like protein [bacterium]